MQVRGVKAAKAVKAAYMDAAAVVMGKQPTAPMGATDTTANGETSYM